MPYTIQAPQSLAYTWYESRITPFITALVFTTPYLYAKNSIPGLETDIV